MPFPQLANFTGALAPCAAQYLQYELCSHCEKFIFQSITQGFAL